MKFLEGFDQQQREWFEGEFAKGRRHFATNGFDDYYYASAQLPTSPEDQQRVVTFSYAVSADGNQLVGVVPRDAVSGVVQAPEMTFELPFLNDAIADELKAVFGEDTLGICVLMTHGDIDAVVISSSEVPMPPVVPPGLLHQQVLFGGLTALANHH